MALRDLIAEKSVLDEAAIERIVGAYVRYDVEAKEITFMPAFAGLSNKAKILIYLVALQGWKYISDEEISCDARPAEIEAATGIAGGSLRPTLRDLRESHVLAEKDSRYTVRATSFPVIEAELNGGSEVPVRRARPVARRAGRKGRDGTDEPPVDDALAVDTDIEDGDESPIEGSKRVRKISGKTRNIAAMFERWIDEGYFDKPRTLADVQMRFRKQAVMVPQTSLPGYFLRAVRKGRLSRDEMEVNGKTMWAYTTDKVSA